MMPRIVQVSSKHWVATLKLCLAAFCTVALIAALACGKYGKPERTPQPDPPVSASADLDERATAQDSDEARKKRKP